MIPPWLRRFGGDLREFGRFLRAYRRWLLLSLLAMCLLIGGIILTNNPRALSFFLYSSE